jgi:hypothetical protein
MSRKEILTLSIPNPLNAYNTDTAVSIPLGVGTIGSIRNTT